MKKEGDNLKDFYHSHRENYNFRVKVVELIEKLGLDASVKEECFQLFKSYPGTYQGGSLGLPTAFIYRACLNLGRPVSLSQLSVRVPLTMGYISRCLLRVRRL
jgi:hypothetical protein